MKKLIALSLLAVFLVPASAQGSSTEGTTECFRKDGQIWFVSHLHTYGKHINYEFYGHQLGYENDDLNGYRVVLDAVTGGEWNWTFRSDPRPRSDWVYRLYFVEEIGHSRVLIAYWKSGQTRFRDCVIR